MPETRPEIRAAREPLTPTEFKRALEQGLGRAILCLQQHDPAPYREIVLEACLQDTRFDAQCEGSRVPYLLEAMELIGDVAFFEQRILEAYPETPTVTPEFHENTWLEQQFSDFAFEFAQRESSFARRLLYESFAANPMYSDRFALERDVNIIKLDGLEGLSFVLEQYAQVAKNDSDFYIDSPFRHLVTVLGVADVQSYVEKLCAEDADIKALIDRSKLSQISEPYSQPVRRKLRALAYDVLVRQVQRRSPYPGGVFGWARRANQLLLRRAARDLLLQTDPELIRGYLHAFRSRKFPLTVRHLLKLARHENADVRVGALVAMQHIQHPAVRTLALELRHDSVMMAEAVGMLQSNYELGDAEIILETIHRFPDQETLHWFGYRMIDIYRKNRVPEALEPLTALYEVTPCSNCREYAVKLLHEIGILPNWMLKEAAWDSCERTRTNTRAWMTAA